MSTITSHSPSQTLSAEEFASSDESLVMLLQRHGGLSVGELERLMHVTATAVRQRLSRLTAMGLVERKAHKANRGRPVHRYELTAKGRREAGVNFADLATALWEELREIADPQVRRGLLQRVSNRLSQQYRGQVGGDTTEDRMKGVSEVFGNRKIPFTVEMKDSLPILTAHACPYPELAEKDRSVCAMERMLFSELVGEKLTLENCRLDGDSCCSFQPSRLEQTEPTLEST
jgi:DeoR family transcriptional regulator, suf operon transcriptional repressor